MNPLFTALLGSVVRWFVTLAAARGFVLSDDQVTQVVMGAIAVAPLAWSQVRVWLNRRKLVTALAHGATTERSVEFTIRSGGAAAVLTPKSEVPS